MIMNILKIIAIAYGVVMIVGVAIIVLLWKTREQKIVDIILMSPLEGVLTFEGKPLSNAKLNVFLRWKDKVGENHTYFTDADGRFSIPVHKVRGTLCPLAQLVIGQTITVFHGGVEYEVWRRSKREPEIYTELNGRPRGLVCELTAGERLHSGKHSFGTTIFAWESLDVPDEQSDSQSA